jgi:hypothetical protein
MVDVRLAGAVGLFGRRGEGTHGANDSAAISRTANEHTSLMASVSPRFRPAFAGLPSTTKPRARPAFARRTLHRAVSARRFLGFLLIALLALGAWCEGALADITAVSVQTLRPAPQFGPDEYSSPVSASAGACTPYTFQDVTYPCVVELAAYFEWEKDGAVVAQGLPIFDVRGEPNSGVSGSGVGHIGEPPAAGGAFLVITVDYFGIGQPSPPPGQISLITEKIPITFSGSGGTTGPPTPGPSANACLHANLFGLSPAQRTQERVFAAADATWAHEDADWAHRLDIWYLAELAGAKLKPQAAHTVDLLNKALDGINAALESAHLGDQRAQAALAALRAELKRLRPGSRNFTKVAKKVTAAKTSADEARAQLHRVEKNSSTRLDGIFAKAPVLEAALKGLAKLLNGVDLARDVLVLHMVQMSGAAAFENWLAQPPKGCKEPTLTSADATPTPTLATAAQAETSVTPRIIPHVNAGPLLSGGQARAVNRERDLQARVVATVSALRSSGTRSALTGRSRATTRRRFRSLSNTLRGLILAEWKARKQLASKLKLPSASASASAIAAADAGYRHVVAGDERFASLLGPTGSVKPIFAAPLPAVPQGTEIDPAALVVPETAAQVRQRADALSHVKP